MTQQLQGCDMKIALSHHPSSWAQPSEDPKIDHMLKANFDFHLHGHEHEGWIEFSENDSHCRIAAGAVYVRKDKNKQSCFNMVRLNIETQIGEVWFRGYDETGDGGWVTKEIPGKTDAAGRKVLSLSNLLPNLCPISTTEESPEISVKSEIFDDEKNVSAAAIRGIYGRDQQIRELAKAIDKYSIIVVAGLPGIGKTWCIDETLEFELTGEWRKQQFLVEEGWGLDEIFSFISPSLTIADDFSEPPPAFFGKRDWRAFLSASNRAKPIVFKIGRAEYLIENARFASEDILEFFQVLCSLNNVRLVLESRKSLDKGQLPGDISLKIIQLKGLQIDALRSFFVRPDPVRRPSFGWKLSDEQAHLIFSRLGGYEGKQSLAHPLGMRLLAVLSDDIGQHPCDILERKSERFYQRLEKELFIELLEKALTEPRRKMLEVASLYRNEIPDVHVDVLSEYVKNARAFDDLRQRFLINSSPGEDYYYVHDLVRDLTQIQIERAGDEQKIKMHRLLGEMWLKPIRRAKRTSGPNRRAATEALYHILQSGSYGLLSELPKNMIRGGNLIKKVEDMAKSYHQKGDDDTYKNLLEFLVEYNPHDHKSHRFLGETKERLYGKGSEERILGYIVYCNIY